VIFLSGLAGGSNYAIIPPATPSSGRAELRALPGGMLRPQPPSIETAVLDSIRALGRNKELRAQFVADVEADDRNRNLVGNANAANGDQPLNFVRHPRASLHLLYW